MSVHHRACPGRFGFGDFERGRTKGGPDAFVNRVSWFVDRGS